MVRPASKGFGITVSVNASLVLEAFTLNYECVAPQSAVLYKLTRQESYTALKELKDKNLITFGRPYKLTKKGIRFINNKVIKYD
jgi:hypothetical protein